MSYMHDPAHPGEVLREYLPEGMSVTEAPRRLGVTRQSLSAILKCQHTLMTVGANRGRREVR